MAAIVRGGSPYAAKPRPKAPAKGQASRKRASARSAPYAPAKLRAAQGVGLRPGAALGVSAALLAAVLAVALFTGDRLHRVADQAMQGVSARFARLGFKVAAVHVQGASPEAKADILRASGLYREEPILGVNLDAVRDRIQHVGWVKDARVVRLLPDTLIITVIERGRAAVWQHNGRTFVVDDKGQVIPEADPRGFTGLPLVVGAGANEASAEILPLVRGRPRLMERMEALVRVDGRRWDIRMKDGGLIQLPAQGAESALIQLDQMDQTSRILDLGLARIDLRDPELVAVRPRDGGSPVEPEVVAGA